MWAADIRISWPAAAVFCELIIAPGTHDRNILGSITGGRQCDRDSAIESQRCDRRMKRRKNDRRQCTSPSDVKGEAQLLRSNCRWPVRYKVAANRRLSYHAMMARTWLSATPYGRAICYFVQQHGNLRDARRSFAALCVVAVVSSRKLALCRLRQVPRPRSRI